MGAMNANYLQWILSNELCAQFDEQIHCFRIGGFTMTPTTEFDIFTLILFNYILVVESTGVGQINPKTQF